MAELPTAQDVWFKRLDRTGAGPSGPRRTDEPFMTLWRQLLEVSANCPELMLIPAGGRVSYEPNPWYADRPTRS